VSNLGEIMKAAAEDMKAHLAKTRAAIPHNLSKGEAAEETLRRFLRRHLPASIGIASGFVVDSKGATSKQMDVILYDVAHTPLLFTSDEGGHQLVPSEGVIAVVEVKVQMTPSMVESVFANMQSVKTLDKSSFIDQDTAIQTWVQVYGGKYKLFPTMYFVFAYEVKGKDVPQIWDKLLPLQDSAPLDQRVDCLCFLNQGLLVNQKQHPFRIEAIPSPGSEFMPAIPKNPLLVWYLLITAFLFQARGRPIRLNNYIPSGFEI
jgi:hypothetical protein